MNWPAINKVQTIVFDFDGVFTDNGVSLSEDGKESIHCSRYDGVGITMLQKFIKKNKRNTN